MKLLIIVGARPQFIKAVALFWELANHPEIQSILVHTGQHFDDGMSTIFFEELKIPEPNYHLGVNRLKHGAMTGRMLEKIEEALVEEMPDMVLVFGDTNSTLAGALASAKMHIPVAHVEAGVRSFNRRMPEEINRVLCDAMANLLFCPNETAVQNLEKEGMTKENRLIVNCGNIMHESFYAFYNDAELTSDLKGWLGEGEFVLATVHREENTNNLQNLEAIVSALNEIHKSTKVILPLHPGTKAAIDRFDLNLEVLTVEPVLYLSMLGLLKHCKMVITDSGGLQNESRLAEKACIVLRNETEWTELGKWEAYNLTGANSSRIIEAYYKMKDKKVSFDLDRKDAMDVSKSIVENLIHYSSEFI